MHPLTLLYILLTVASVLYIFSDSPFPPFRQ